MFEFSSLRRVLATGLDSRHAVAFVAGARRTGAADVTLLGIDFDRLTTIEHALGGPAATPDPGVSRVAEFLAATTEVADGDDLDEVPDPEPTWRAALGARSSS